MLNNIHALSFRPPIVNINCTIAARAHPLIGGYRSQVRRAMQGEWFRVATQTPAASALQEMAELDDNLALTGPTGNRMPAAGNLFL
jgi:hypothetical protein